MPNRTAVVAALLLCGALSADAQLVESIEVRVTNIDVVVTDAKGNPVTGLTKNDFELRENKRLQTITNFYEVKGEMAISDTPGEAPDAVPPAVRQRRLVVFVDNYSIEPRRRNQVFEAIDAALDSLMHEGDEVMLAVWNRSLEIAQPLTVRHGDLRAALDRVARRNTQAAYLGSERERIIRDAAELRAFVRANPRLMRMIDAYNQSTSDGRVLADHLYRDQKNLIAAVKRTLASLAGLDGRKVLLFVGANLEENVGLDIFQSIDSVYIPEGVVTGTARSREAERDMTLDLEALGRAANADGVTMYMVDAADRSGRMRDASQAAIGDSEAEFTTLTSSPQAMGMLASLTGGTLLSATRNFKATLDTIGRDLGSYYSLGYKSDATGNESRNIGVRVNRPGVRVRARRSFTPKSRDEEMRDRVIANAFHPSVRNELQVTVEAGRAQTHEKGMRVPFTITFPSDLTMLPDGDSLVGEFAVYLVVADDNGDMSAIGKDVQKVRIPAKVAAAVRQKPFQYTSAVVVRKGHEQAISVGIVDQVSGRSGFAKTTILAQ